RLWEIEGCKRTPVQLRNLPQVRQGRARFPSLPGLKPIDWHLETVRSHTSRKPRSVASPHEKCRVGACLDAACHYAPSLPRGCQNLPIDPVLLQQLDLRLCGVSIVELEQAAESLTTLHLACADDRFLRRDEFVAQALVRPFLMIM